MFASKCRIAQALLVGAAVLGVTAPTYGQGRDGREAGRAEVRGLFKSIDTGAGTITISSGGGREQQAADKTYSLAKDVEVAIGAGFGRGSAVREGKLGQLTPGTAVALTLSAEQHVDSILAENPVVRGQLKAIDAGKKTITIGQAAGREAAGEEKTYSLAAGVEIAVDDGRGRRFSIKEGQLGDLATGAIVAAQLSLDRQEVQGILAEGPSLMGVVKAVDAKNRTVVLATRPARGDDAGEERTLVVSPDATVQLDDGKGRRLPLREAKLGDVPVGSMAGAKLSVDQGTVMSLRAEGPSLGGLLKAVDASKGTIVIAIPKGRDDFEEKTLTLAKDARISVDGAATKLSDLKVNDNGPHLQLRLTLDQQAVQAVVAAQVRPR